MNADYFAKPDACDASVDLYTYGFLAIVIIRVLIFLEIARLWRKARRSESIKRKARGVATGFLGHRRFPIVPSLHFLSVVFLILMYVLTLKNVVSGPRGTTHVLMILWVTPFCIIEGFALRKLVRLGKRIIPWQGSMQSGEDIGKFDSWLRFLAILMVILFFLCWLGVIIGCFVHPLVFHRISLGSLLVHQILFFSSLVYQVSSVSCRKRCRA